MIDEGTTRIEKLQQELQKKDIQGALIVSNINLYYFSGTAQNGFLLVPSDDPPTLFVRRVLERAREESWVDNVYELRSWKSDIFPKLESMRNLGVEMDFLPVQNYIRLQNAVDDIKFHDISLVIRFIRAIKTANELVKIREAAKIVDAGLEAGYSSLQTGVTEWEIQIEIERKMREEGHMGPVPYHGIGTGTVMHYGICVSGVNAALPSHLEAVIGGEGLYRAYPQGASKKKIVEDEPVIIDFVGAYDGYLADQTRTVWMGVLPSDLEEALEASRHIQKNLAKAAVPGVPAGEIFEFAKRLAIDYGIGEHFMGYGPSAVKFVGHGVGMELDEFPVLAEGRIGQQQLQEGMVIALEPKFIFPGRGAVGIEDTFVVKGASGAERLTNACTGKDSIA